MPTDVTTIVIPLRNSTPLGRLSYNEALGALNQLNSLGWTIGGTTGFVADPVLFQPTDTVGPDGSLYTAPYDHARLTTGVIELIRNTYPPAARLTPGEWANIFTAIINLVGITMVSAP